MCKYFFLAVNVKGFEQRNKRSMSGNFIILLNVSCELQTLDKQSTKFFLTTTDWTDFKGTKLQKNIGLDDWVIYWRILHRLSFTSYIYIYSSRNFTAKLRWGATRGIYVYVNPKQSTCVLIKKVTSNGKTLK